MFWKRFTQARSADKLFNEATKHWVKMRSYLFEDEAKACAELSEVTRLCQLSIETDPRSGNAYVLLANALTSAASHGSGRLDRERYQFLQSRAAAVIHFWYTLPHRGYPTTLRNNTKIGDRLWRIIFDEISQDKTLSEDATATLLESYRESLAAETISPGSFEQIQRMMSRTMSTPEPNECELQEPLEEILLSPETWYFLAEILPKAVQMESHKEQVTIDRFAQIEAAVDKLKRLVRDSPRIFHASTELLDRVQQARHDNDFRQAIGWVAWLFILEMYSESIIPDSSSKEEDMAKHWKVLVELLRGLIAEGRQAEDWDALLLAVGFFKWAGLSKWGDEVLRVLYARIGEQAADSRLLDIERQPRMLVEDLLVSRLQHHLGKS